jgi:hypothetical protein
VVAHVAGVLGHHRLDLGAELGVHQRRLPKRGELDGVAGVEPPEPLDVPAHRRAVGEVLAVLGVRCQHRFVALGQYVGKQCLEQFLLAGEVVVERPGRPPGLGSDVGDLGVEVPLPREHPPGRVLQRHLGLGRLLLALHQVPP